MYPNNHGKGISNFKIRLRGVSMSASFFYGVELKRHTRPFRGCEPGICRFQVPRLRGPEAPASCSTKTSSAPGADQLQGAHHQRAALRPKQHGQQVGVSFFVFCFLLFLLFLGGEPKHGIGFPVGFPKRVKKTPCILLETPPVSCRGVDVGLCQPSPFENPHWYPELFE